MFRDYPGRKNASKFLDPEANCGSWVSADNREKAGVAGGDEVDVDIELDTEPRDVTVPPDFAAALSRHAKAREHFDSLSNSGKKAFVQGIEGTKAAETRQRRIDKAIADLRKAAMQG
ncbi:MAG: YdeI/OmpD-associated family protein [Bryobacteraceae bacterium]